MKSIDVTIKGSTQSFELQAKGKKGGGNLRSQMLKQVMPKLSGERGKALEQAFADKDKDKIRKILTEITDELANAAN